MENTKKMIVVLTVKEAVQILREHGFQTNVLHIYAGLDCGAYDFGRAIPTKKSTIYEVYKEPLMRWIEDKSSVIEENKET